MIKRVLLSLACALPMVWGATAATAFTTSSATDAGGGTAFADPDQKVSAFGGSEEAAPVAWSLLATKSAVNPPPPRASLRGPVSSKDEAPASVAP
jgi:hypothetical protein